MKRHWLPVLALTLLLGAPALAKDNKSKDPPQIEMTGLESLDGMFGKAKGIDERLTKAKQQLRSSKKQLNTALGLEKGTPIKDGLDDLKGKADGKMAVAMKGNKPTLEATDAVPENVQNALNAVNKMVDNITGSIEELAGVPEEAQGLVDEAKEAPGKLKGEMKSSGMKLTELPKKMKLVKTNVDITAGLPDKANDVMGRMTDLLARVAELAPKKEEAAEEPAPEGGAPEGEAPAEEPKE